MTGLHVLVAQGSDEAYGSDRICRLIVGFLRDAGMKVTVALPDDCEPGWLSAGLADDGVRTLRMPLGVARRRYLRPRGIVRYAWDCVRAIRATRRFVRDHEIDVVYLNSLALLPLLAPALPRATKVLHCHEIVVQPAPLRWVQRSTPRLVRMVVCVSDAVANAVDSHNGGRVVVCHNGIADLDAGLLSQLEVKLNAPLDPGKPLTVGFVGRLSTFKGIDAFLQVADRLRDRADLEFVVAGGPIPGETQHLAAVEAASRGNPRLRYVGELADAAPFTLDVDILVVPSRNPDPYPTTVLEGLRAGCVVVASDTGGASEAISSATGLLVPPGDVDELTVVLGSLVADRQRVRQMQHSARVRFCAEHDLAGFQARFLGTVVANLVPDEGDG